MIALDASCILHAWDNYPFENFPPLWDWLSDKINAQEICISQIAFEEAESRSPECGKWLKDNSISKEPLTNSILSEAARIKGLLDIVNDDFHPRGVGENDILIVSTSKIKDSKLLTEERVQPFLPDIKAKYKIPAVCKLPSVDVDYSNFINFIKDSGEVFS